MSERNSFFLKFITAITAPYWLTIGIIYGIYDIFFEEIKKGIIILGMTGSGKSTIYSYYLKQKNVVGQTSTNSYDQFYLDNGEKKILIKKGKDISGGDEFFENSIVQDMITDKETDIIFFVFNAYEYLNDTKYFRNANARIDTINIKNLSNKEFYIIGSHLDKFDGIEEKVIINKIWNKIDGKDYKKYFTNGTFCILKLDNNKSGLDAYFRKIFKSNK